MTARRRTLANEHIDLTFDLDRGADIVALVDRRTGVDVMFRTPWAKRAEEVAHEGSLVWHESSFGAWVESYAGGWQLLCPNAGPPTERAGVVLGFHGEASVVPWTLLDGSDDAVRLQVELHTVPLQIERRLSLAGPVVVVEDVLRNLATVEIELDYQHHPAFGPPLLAPGCMIETGARTFVADGGTAVAWSPSALDTLPPADQPRALLGWLTDFDEPWAAIRNPELDLGVALCWDGDVMPHAWLWQELNGTETYPWYRRAYVMAIEPSSTSTSGPTRAPISLAPGGTLATGMRLALCGGRVPIRSVDAAGNVVTADA